jgi:GGDEF domain-containing protein
VKKGPALYAPALLLPLAAAAAMTHKLPASPSLATLIDAAPLLIFGAGAVLGLVTRRARLLLGVIILAIANSALVNVGSRSVFDAVALLLPINIAVVVWLGDENPYGGRGALLFAITLLQTAIMAVLLNPGLAPVTEALEVPLAKARLGTWTSLSPLTLLVFAAALGLLVARFYMHRQALAAGAAWALVASFLALDAAASGGPVGVHFAAAGALLLASTTRESRHVLTLDKVTRLPARIELHRALHRTTKRYTLAYVEIDEFAQFRGAHGVQATQHLLKVIAKRLRHVGGGGHAYYCEGGTFAVLFPRIPMTVAMRYLDAVRVKVEDVTVDVSIEGPQPASKLVRPGTIERTVSVTISAGVAETARPGDDPKRVIEAAEHALVRAREAGMNRVSR